MRIVHDDARDVPHRQQVGSEGDVADDTPARILRDDETAECGGEAHGQRLHGGVE